MLVFLSSPVTLKNCFKCVFHTWESNWTFAGTTVLLTHPFMYITPMTASVPSAVVVPVHRAFYYDQMAVEAPGRNSWTCTCLKSLGCRTIRTKRPQTLVVPGGGVVDPGFLLSLLVNQEILWHVQRRKEATKWSSLELSFTLGTYNKHLVRLLKTITFPGFFLKITLN